MLNYKNVVVAENRHKVFVCEMNIHSKGIFEQFMRLTVAENDGCGYSLWNNEDYDDLREYIESDIEVILQEYERPLLDDYEDQQDYWDKDEDDEFGVKIDTESLLPFLTSVSNVYKYDSMEELDLIVKALDEPIVDGVGCSWDKDYKKCLSKSYGLLFFWSEYDDFSCGDPFTPYCKIIDGGIVQ